jgi:TetR/AcrR family transcriptional regulator, transcriptional repressor for nem operon
VVDLFQDALLVDDRMCLCGLLGAERDVLPPEVEASVAGFFKMVIAYLDAASGSASKQLGAASVLASLEGGLILARTMRDPSLFNAAVATIRSPELH